MKSRPEKEPIEFPRRNDSLRALLLVILSFALASLIFGVCALICALINSQ